MSEAEKSSRWLWESQDMVRWACRVMHSAEVKRAQKILEANRHHCKVVREAGIGVGPSNWQESPIFAAAELPKEWTR